MKSLRAAAALAVALGCPALAQVATLQIQVIEGEGGVHLPGARGARPLTVSVTDEAGQPVAHAAVSFHLPEDGPGGVFANGLRTDVATTDERGRAMLRGWQLNRTPGRFQIRITASKEQATAGMVSFQYIAESGGSATQSAKAATGSHSHGKWLALAAIVAGGAAAGVVVTRRGTGAASSSSSASSSTPGVTVGAPTITVGKP